MDYHWRKSYHTIFSLHWRHVEVAVHSEHGHLHKDRPCLGYERLLSQYMKLRLQGARLRLIHTFQEVMIRKNRNSNYDRYSIWRSSRLSSPTLAAFQYA